MVPAAATTAQQRWRTLAADNSLGHGQFPSTRPPQPPKITYGKKATKTLSLTGVQFRNSAYDLPFDDDDEDKESTASSPLFVERRRLGVEDADESSLSGAGDAIQDVPPGQSRIALVGNPRAVIATKSVSVGKSRKLRTEPPITVNRTRATQTQAPEKTRVGQKPRQIKVASKTTPKKRNATPARRLPVSELFLVASPPSCPNHDPLSSCPGVEVQDPINEFSSSPRKRNVSPADLDDDGTVHKALKTPLTAIWRRLQTSKWKHKSITTARKPKDETRSVMMKSDHTEPRGRDGFDASEIVITGRRNTRKQRTQRTMLVPKFHALQLKSGPLPDVKFDLSVKLEPQTQNLDVDDAPVYSANDHQLHQDSFQNQSQRSRRRVSFPSALWDDAIRAQLSSISAPERVSSESGESDTEGEDSDDVDGYDSKEDDTDRASICEDDETAVVEEDAAEDLKNMGVALDFRRPEMGGHASLARSLHRRELMEVRESIVEVPDTSPMKISARRRISQSQQHKFDVQTSHRPRSILKNSTPAIPDSTTMPEQTAANTRRNSIVDLSESRYFTSASNALDQPIQHTTSSFLGAHHTSIMQRWKFQTPIA